MTWSRRLFNYASPTLTELTEIVMTWRATLTLPPLNIAILSHSRRALERRSHSSTCDGGLVDARSSTEQLLSRRKRVEFQLALAHAGVPGNVVADRLAANVTVSRLLFLVLLIIEAETSAPDASARVA